MKKKVIETIMGNKSQQTNTIHLKSQKTESYKNENEINYGENKLSEFAALFTVAEVQTLYSKHCK